MTNSRCQRCMAVPAAMIAFSLIADTPSVAMAQQGQQTLLNYDVSPKQFKIGTTAELLIMVSPRRVAAAAKGPGRHRTVHKQVFVEEITIDFGDMGGTADLTGSPALIETSTPQGWTQVKNDWIFGPLKGWTFKRSGGKFVARATADAGMMGPHSVIMLKLSKIAVGPYGTADLVITEKASIGKDEEKQVRTNPSIPLNKRNPFHVGPLMVDKTHVEKGGKVVVHWAGSSDANYSLGWKADNGEWFDAKLLEKDGKPYAGVPPAGSYAVTDLQSDKVFTLTYKHGGITGIKEISVSVIDPQPTINDFNVTWKQDGNLLLKWDTTEDFERVTISHSPNKTVVPAGGAQSGSIPFKIENNIVPSSFTLHAKRRNIPKEETWTVKRTGYTSELLNVAGSRFWVTVSPDGSRVFLPGYREDNLTVLNARTLKPVPGSPVKVGSRPQGVAASSDGLVYVANSYGSNISILNAQTLKNVGTVTVGKSPGPIAVSPNGSHVYVANQSDNTLSVIDARKKQVIMTVSVGKYPNSVTVSPNGKRVFITSETDSKLTALDASTFSSSSVMVGKGTMGAAVSTDSKRVFVASENGWRATLSVLDAQTLKPVIDKPIDIAPKPKRLAVSPDGKRVFVPSQNRKNVTILDAHTLEPVAGSPMSTQGGAYAVAVVPTGRVFIANTSGTVMVLSEEFERVDAVQP